MSEERKENLIAFRVTDNYFEKVNRLCDKLGLTRSQTIRMMLDRGIEEFLDEKSSLRLVSNKQWNDLVGARLEKFLETITEFSKFTKALTSQVKKTSNVQKSNIIDVTEADLAKWIDLCIKDDRNFNTEDANPEAEKAKKAILTTIQRLKGRVG